MNITNLLDELYLSNHIALEDIPKVDLYMDQVIQLFENTYTPTTRNTEEKVLTKTMINNYAKGKLLPPIKNKKYSREHIMLLNLIYQLKGGLSISDIKSFLDTFILENQSLDIAEIYTTILQLQQKDTHAFIEAVSQKEKEISTDDTANHLLLIVSMIHMSNQYRRVAEKLIDQLHVEKATE